MSKRKRGSNLRRKRESRGCRGCLSIPVKGCLLLIKLLIILSILSPIGIGIVLYTTIIPAAEASNPDNLGPAMSFATDHLQGIGGPLPGEVISNPALDSFARQRGLEESFGKFYQLQSCIAAADRLGITRKHLCALMDLEGGWPSEIEPMTFVIAIATAKGFLELGYDPSSPEIIKEWVDEDGNVCLVDADECINPKLVCENDTCRAISAYFADDEALMGEFERLSEEWAIAETAEIEDRGFNPIWWPNYLIEFWTLLDLGYDSLIIVGSGGDDIIILDDPPPVPDGVFARPYPGSGRTSYNWLQPVYAYDKNGEIIRDKDGNPVIRILHPGQDFGRSDDYGKTVGHPLVAMHNGEVVYAQMLPAATGLAAHWWISGVVVITYTEVPDGPAMCIFQGHGAVGTLRVSVGDQVGAGQQIMNAGSTGFSSDVHDHVAIKRGGEYPYCEGGGFVDPNPYIPY